MLDEMKEMQEIEEKLKLLPAEIEKKSVEVNTARKNWQLKKAEYELKYHKVILTTKAKMEGRTQTDLKSEAVLESHQERLNMITAEATYESSKTELKGLMNQLDSVRERGWNLRAIIKRFEG